MKAKKEKEVKSKVTRIEVQIGDRPIALTLEEARELYTTLKELFGRNGIYDRHPWEIPLSDPYRWPPLKQTYRSTNPYGTGIDSICESLL